MRVGTRELRLARVAPSREQAKRHARGHKKKCQSFTMAVRSTSVWCSHWLNVYIGLQTDGLRRITPSWASSCGARYKYRLVLNNFKTHLGFCHPGTCYMQTDNQRWEVYLPEVHGHEFRAVDWMQVITARVKMPGKPTMNTQWQNKGLLWVNIKCETNNSATALQRLINMRLIWSYM